MLVPPCSFTTQSSSATGCLTSNSHPKILFCIADFILSLQRAARILLLCRIYIVVDLQSYFGLVCRLLQDGLLLVTIELFPKTGHNFGLCLLPYELQSSTVVLENSLHSENISWDLPYCCPFVIPASFTDKCYMQKFGMEAGSPHKSFLALHSQLSYN